MGVALLASTLASSHSQGEQQVEIFDSCLSVLSLEWQEFSVLLLMLYGKPGPSHSIETAK